MKPAIIANACLDGVHIEEPAAAWKIKTAKQTTTTQLSLGGRRQSYLYLTAGYPMIGAKLEITLLWHTLHNFHARVEELMAVPGPHELILWRQEFRAWVGNGSRTEFFLPWPIAIDAWTGDPPGGANGIDPVTGVGRAVPEIKVGLGGANLTYLLKSSVDYAAGTPAVGAVWFLQGGQAFKLNSAPGAGVHVFGRVMPALQVEEQGESEKQLSSPAPEPRDLVLLEA